MRVGNIGAVAEKTGFSKSKIWRDDSNGTMPKSFKISDNKTVWDLDEIDAWLESKKAARNAAPAVPRVSPVAPSTRTDCRKPGRPRKVQVVEAPHHA